MPNNLKVARWVRRIVAMTMPLFIGFSWMTLVIGPAYVRYEYGRPDFPSGLEGMPPATAAGLEMRPLAQNERLELALVAVAFLESWQPAEAAIAMLARQQLPGTDTPLYNQRELNHLVDVKRLTDGIRWLALATAVPVIGGFLFLSRWPRTRRHGYLALAQGGLLTLILTSGVASLIFFGWSFFFYQFHGLFFPSGTWLFAETDSLMRLYPEPLFYDAGLVMSGGTWLGGGLAMVAGCFLAWRCAVAEKEERQLAHVAEAIR